MSTSIATTSLSDALPSSIPKLDASGSNWAIFVFCFEDAIEAKEFWEHFDGTVSHPVPADVAAPTTTEVAAIAQWDKDERSAKSLLTQKLPDSTVVMVHGKKTVKERWDAVVMEFSKKSAYAQADMRAKFMAMRCPDKGNPREFLEGLRVKKEELAQAGVTVEEKDYFSIIISSLPYALSNFASSQLAAAQYLSSKKMTPEDLLSMLLEESDRQQAQFQRRRAPGKGKEDSNKALSADQSSRSKKGKGHAHKHADVTCWNCDDKGHISRNCKKPRRSKSKDDSGKKEGNAKASGSGSGSASAVEQVKEEDGAWVAVEEELDWFEEVAEAENDEGKRDAVVEDLGDTSDSDEDEAFVIAETVESSGTAELYDSGCTNHISPYQSQFENFEQTSPRSFKAANKQTFSTIGKGDLVIDVPNGDTFTKLRLTDMQYSPNVAYTLVSIGRLDDEGYTAKFGKGRCVLEGLDGERIGEVLRTKRKAYKVEHEEMANAAEETLTLDRLHRQMGHASTQVIRDLVSQGMVTGIRLEYTPSKVPFFCESCIYGKATRKSVPKLCEGERATIFSGEIHSDLWGKSPVELKGGKNYMDMYIDDKTRLTHVYFF